MTSNFKPPLIESTIVTYHQAGEGLIDRAELLIMDANRRLFTLTVATLEDFIALIHESATDGGVEAGGENEPVFLVPATFLEPETLEQVCAMPATLLAHYLVEQAAAA